MFSRVKEIVTNIKISKRLTTIIFAIGLLVVVYGALIVQNITQSNKNIRRINEVHLENLVNLSELVENIYSVLLENHILSENSLKPNSVNVSINMDVINSTIRNYSQSVTNETQSVLFDNFSIEFFNYIAVLKDIDVLKLAGQFELANEVQLTREIKTFRKMQSNLKLLIDYNKKLVKKNSATIRKIENDSLIKTYIFSTLLFLISVGSILLLIKDISYSLHKLTKNLTTLSIGEIPKTQVDESDNEIGVMAKLTNKLTDSLSNLNQFAITLSKGNYSNKFEFQGSSDFIGKALVDLRNSLKLSQEKDKVRKIEEERRNWTNKGHALFGEILRQRSGGISYLTDDIIKNLVRYLKANQGGLFLIDDSQEENKIELASAFAYNSKKFFAKAVSLGDGLIGTVALERNTIYLKEIPEDYIEIESGLGDANPNSLLIVPLKFENEILGVVEIASFKDFKDFEITFVEELAQSIASTLLTAKISTRTENLLEESEKKSQALAAQETEMRQNITEMRKTQELAQKREADLRGILSAVDNTLMKGEYDTDGTLLSVNNRHLQTMGYDLSEIIGKNIEIFIPGSELKEFKKLWRNVVNGNPRQIEVRRNTKSGDLIWLINQYTPVQDEKGNINKVLYLAHDITKYKKSESEAKHRLLDISNKDAEIKKDDEDFEKTRNDISTQNIETKEILKAINTNLLVLEYDVDGLITDVNQNFLDLFQKKPDEMIGFKINKCVDIDRGESELQDIWEELIKGNKQKKITKFKTTKGNFIWLDEVYTPIFNKDNKVLKVINIAVNISNLKLTEEKNSILLNETQEYLNIITNKDSELQEILLDLQQHKQDLVQAKKENKTVLGVEVLEGQNKLIELKKKELNGIQKEISSLKKSKHSLHSKMFDNDQAKLYNTWLNNLKKQLK